MFKPQIYSLPVILAATLALGCSTDTSNGGGGSCDSCDTATSKLQIRKIALANCSGATAAGWQSDAGVLDAGVLIDAGVQSSVIRCSRGTYSGDMLDQRVFVESVVAAISPSNHSAAQFFNVDGDVEFDLLSMDWQEGTQFKLIVNGTVYFDKFRQSTNFSVESDILDINTLDGLVFAAPFAQVPIGILDVTRQHRNVEASFTGTLAGVDFFETIVIDTSATGIAMGTLPLLVDFDTTAQVFGVLATPDVVLAKEGISMNVPHIMNLTDRSEAMPIVIEAGGRVRSATPADLSF